MTEIIRIRNGEILQDSPVCSRCGMSYGAWELTVTWDRDKELKVFNHLVGCRWSVGADKKDFGPRLRDAGIVPSNANIIRLQ